MIVICCVILFAFNCKKEPEGPTEADIAESKRISEEQAKKQERIIAALQTQNEPITYDNIEDVLGGIVYDYGQNSLEEVKPFKYFCFQSDTRFGTKLFADGTATHQNDYVDPVDEGSWHSLNKQKAILDMNYVSGTIKYTFELTEKPQVLKIAYKEEGKDVIFYQSFCYTENHKFAQEVVIPKLNIE